MANLAWQQSHAGHPSGQSSPSSPSSPIVAIRRSVVQLAIATIVLMAIGSATRVMNAGLACPDWPLCYGVLVPRQQMNLQVFLEWFHRLDASLIGVMAMVLVVRCWWQRQQLPAWLPWAMTLALVLVIGQGALGGLTVTELLRFDIVTAHLGMAQLFFTLLVAIGTMLMPYQGTGTVGKLPWVALAASIAVYGQSLLGGLVASQWAVHQCLGADQLCTVMNSHIGGVVLPTTLVLTLVILTYRTPALKPALRQLAWLAGIILVAQVGLGVATLYLHLQVEPLTVSHHTTSAILLGVLVMFTVYALRDRASIPHPAVATSPVSDDEPSLFA